jgi:radical SAM superfamily enzyme YgiQ (UPF0313 family)
VKVLIVNPPTLSGMRYVREGRCEQRLNSFQYVMVPISLPLVAAVLEKDGHEVKIIDCVAEEMGVDGLREAVKAFDPAMLLLNMSTATSMSDMRVVDLLRGETKAHLTVIGNHPTSLPDEVLGACRLDSVIRREPERTAQDLAATLAKGGPLADVLGLSWKDPQGKVTHNADRPFERDLDSLPFPARHLLPNERYTLPVINEPYTLIVTSRGCPHGCVYCTAWQYYGREVRLRSAVNVVDEMEQCLTRQGVRNFTMWSDTFNQSRPFVMEVCAEIRERGLEGKVRWMTNSRVDHVDREALSAMKAAGCMGISYGIESGVDEILQAIKKGATTAQAREAVRLTKEAGIEVLAHVVLGLPGETPETIRRTVDFVKELDPDYAQFYCAIPFPKTPFEKLARSEGWVTTDDYSKYELNQAILSTPALPAEKLRDARRKAYREFYLRPSYLWKRLKKVRTPRELWTNVRQGWDFVRHWI